LKPNGCKVHRHKKVNRFLATVMLPSHQFTSNVGLNRAATLEVAHQVPFSFSPLPSLTVGLESWMNHQFETSWPEERATPPRTLRTTC
jgi:hypothetical protein